MLRSLMFQIQIFIAIVKKMMFLSAIAGYTGVCVWAGVQIAESPFYKGAVAANNAKNGFISEVQKFNPFKQEKQ